MREFTDTKVSTNYIIKHSLINHFLNLVFQNSIEQANTKPAALDTLTL